MKRNFCKTKLNGILICTLVLVAVLQVGMMSIVQATDDAMERHDSPPVPLDDTVVVSSDDPNLISNQDEVAVMPEGGKVISPLPENLTDREEIEKTVTVDDTTIGLPEESNRESELEDNSTIGLVEDDNQEYNSLIAPNTVSRFQIPLVGVATLSIAIAAISLAFLVVGYKKAK